jgi:hypothetical protein
VSRRDLWRCAACGRPFANANQPHSCVRVGEETHLAGKNPHIADLYRGFVAKVEECGPVIVVPAKTRIGFQVRMIFAAVNGFTKRGFTAHVVLARRLESPRFTRIESLSPRNHVHHFRINDPSQLDEELGAWLREAYAVGEQRHIGRCADEGDRP